jgi:predicted metal-binding membrane protein
MLGAIQPIASACGAAVAGERRLEGCHVQRTWTLIALSVAVSIAMSLLATAFVKVLPRLKVREKEVEP